MLRTYPVILQVLKQLQAAQACGYVPAVEVALRERLRRVVGTLVRLVAA